MQVCFHGYSKTKIGRILLAGKITTSINTKNVDGMKYYKIKIYDDDTQKTVWINKSTLLPSEVTIKIGDTEISYNYEIVFGSVKNEQVAEPDLTEYTIQENTEE